MKQIWHAACFCMACVFEIFFTFFLTMKNIYGKIYILNVLDVHFSDIK